MTESMGFTEEGLKRRIEELKEPEDYIEKVLAEELLHAVRAERRTTEEWKRTEEYAKTLRKELHEGIERQKLLVKAIGEETERKNVKQPKQ